MPYTTPQFNVPVDVWSSGHVPSVDAPDFENVASQFYVYSRVSFDVQPCELELYQPPIQIRVPIAAIVPWTAGQVFEVPAESGRYYRARFKDRLHLGFPNEYLVIWVVQCNSDGVPVLRDIEGAVPCGGPTPADQEGTGSGVGNIVYFGVGFSTNSTPGGEHVGSGEGQIEGTYESQGEGTNHNTEHIGDGEGDINGFLEGSGESTNT